MIEIYTTAAFDELFLRLPKKFRLRLIKNNTI